MPNKRSSAAAAGPHDGAHLAVVRHAMAPQVAPLQRLPGIVTCCFCGARVREAELVRPIWGPRPCPQGHRHHPLEVVARCRACYEADRRRLAEHARAVMRLQEELARGSAPPEGATPARSRHGGRRQTGEALRQARLL